MVFFIPQLINNNYCTKLSITDEIKQQIEKSPVVLYMKGSPSAPQCGFSKKVVDMLKYTDIEEFDSYNVLADEELRDGIKQYSEWPTIPQLYVKGNFVGGCDIVTELFQSGELKTLLVDAGVVLEKKETENK